MTLKILMLIELVIILPLFTRAADPDPNQAVGSPSNSAVDPDPNPAVDSNQEDPPVQIVGYNGVSVSRSIASFLHAFRDFKIISDWMMV